MGKMSGSQQGSNMSNQGNHPKPSTGNMPGSGSGGSSSSGGSGTHSGNR